jgi:hypothetical protein
MRWVGGVVHIVQLRFLMGKSEGKRPSGRYRRRYEDNIKIDVKGKGWDGVHWFYVTQERAQ